MIFDINLSVLIHLIVNQGETFNVLVTLINVVIEQIFSREN